ncbi:hypothetical protein ACFX2G_035716 [Malus domestica]
MQGHTSRMKELEKVVEQENLDLENLETSRGKVMKRLSVTVSKFDELHQLAASLLAEVEELQSQLQGQDDEISFMRQEVTRCTNDVLAASQTSNKRNAEEIHELLTWLDMNIARVRQKLSLPSSTGYTSYVGIISSSALQLLEDPLYSAATNARMAGSAMVCSRRCNKDVRRCGNQQG